MGLKILLADLNYGQHFAFICIYLYIYMCVCVCLCVCLSEVFAVDLFPALPISYRCHYKKIYILLILGKAPAKQEH